MGKYLDQCADDAWEVISGRKKELWGRVERNYKRNLGALK